MKPSVLHILSQRPFLTGSGVTLDALVRLAARAGWEQRAVVGVPAEEGHPRIGDLPGEQILPLFFERHPLTFPVPGMSDVMPYRSTRFSTMTVAQLDAYRAAWRAHLADVLAAFRPNVIHAHHLWIVSSLLKDLAPDIPVVMHCHSTALRQLQLCPHLAEKIVAGCARNEAVVALQPGHVERIAATYGIDRARIHVVGAGYRDELFHTRGREAATSAGQAVYIGKYSAAKGLPWLLDAVERLREEFPHLELHVAGDGAGAEAEALRERMAAMAPLVKMHGQLPQEKLAELLRGCAVCVLPSFYEGVPLVLVEALACGCRLASTALPGVVEVLAPHLGEALELIALPRLSGPDVPLAGDLPAFTDRLTEALRRSLAQPPLREPSCASLEPFTWHSTFQRVESVWRSLI
ncbi:MAG TPA: glycosyltransferase family 4 protein [bacterium]|nr:glycosyltransferase family 4 protein [bacterium]